eukprot:359654-Chlamydomonas_euryale.AAC.1
MYIPTWSGVWSDNSGQLSLRQPNGSDGVSPLIPHLNDRQVQKGRHKGRKGKGKTCKGKERKEKKRKKRKKQGRQAKTRKHMRHPQRAGHA